MSGSKWVYRHAENRESSKCTYTAELYTHREGIGSCRVRYGIQRREEVTVKSWLIVQNGAEKIKVTEQG